MGTSYYLSTNDKLIRDRWLNIGESILTDTPDWGYEIRICKISFGWYPLFTAYDNIKSFSDYKKLYNSDGWVLYDEYGTQWRWEDFEAKINANQNKHMRSHIELDRSVYKDPDGYEFWNRESG